MKKSKFMILVIAIVLLTVVFTACSRNKVNTTKPVTSLAKYSYDYDSYSSAGIASLFLWSLIGIGVACIFGYICKNMAENREIEPKTAFWWGFWMTWIGIIVVLSKPERKTRYSDNYNSGYNSNRTVFSHTAPAKEEPKEAKDELLLRLQKNIHLAEGPVGLKRIDLMKTKDGITYIINTFRNISEKNITAVLISIEGRDPFGNVADSIPSFSYIDLNVAPKTVFGTNKKAVLGSGNSRNVDINVTSVIFDDGSRWTNEGATWVEDEIEKAFVFADFETELYRKSNASEIVEFIESQGFEDDALHETLEDLKKLVHMEKIYGNQKSQVLKVLKDKF